MKKYAKIGAVILVIAMLFSSYSIAGFSAGDYVESGDFIFADNGNGTLTLKKYKGDGGVVDVPAMVSGKKVTTVGYDAFGESYYSTQDSVRITKVILPVTVTTVEKMAFLECTKLSDISMIGVKSIGDGAFWDCTALKKVAVSCALKNIGENVFGGNCKGVKLYCEKGSYAEKYAKENSIPYSALYPEKITFAKKSYSVSQGKSINIKYTVTPSDAYYGEVYLYSAGKYTSVLSQSGKVKGVKTGKEKVKCIALYGNATAECEVNVKIPTVSKLTASKRKFTSIKLSWSKAKNADGYQLEMKSGGKWKRIAQTEKQSFELKNLSPKTSYSFRVRSYCVKKGKTLYGEWVTLSTSTLKLGKVSGVKANPTSDGYLSFSWNKVSNAKKYVVYSVDENGKAKKLEETKEASFTAKSGSGIVKSYKVRAYTVVNDKRLYGAYSEVVTIAAPPSAVSGLSVSSKGKTSISIKWNKQANADGYAIYTVKDGEYTFVKTTQATSCTFGGLNTNTNYTYAVRAYVKTSLKTVYGKYSTLTVRTDPLYSTEQIVSSNINSAMNKIITQKEFYALCRKSVSVSVTSCSAGKDFENIVEAYANTLSGSETVGYDFVAGTDQSTDKTPTDIFIPENGFSIDSSSVKSAAKTKDGSGYRESLTLKSETVSSNKVPAANSKVWGYIDKEKVALLIQEDAQLESFTVTYTGTLINMKINSNGTFDDYSLSVPFEMKIVCTVNGERAEAVLSGKITKNYTLTWW